MSSWPWRWRCARRRRRSWRSGRGSWRPATSSTTAWLHSWCTLPICLENIFLYREYLGKLTRFYDTNNSDIDFGLSMNDSPLKVSIIFSLCFARKNMWFGFMGTRELLLLLYPLFSVFARKNMWFGFMGTRFGLLLTLNKRNHKVPSWNQLEQMEP